MTALLVLRPEPAARRTARKAEELGLTAIVAPLFTIRPLAWHAPDPAGFDALLLTSGQALRHGGTLDRYHALPVFAVGAATAAAARAAGFAAVRAGTGDAAAAVAMAAAAGRCRLLHLCGREHWVVTHPGTAITALPVYAADAVAALPPAARDAIAAGTTIVLHSPRAGAVLRTLIDPAAIADTAIAAISPAAAAAAGAGWRAVAVADRPTDDALLAAARALCD